MAYVDTSCLLAVAFQEPGAEVMATRLQKYDILFSSNLLEAEMRSALTREKVAGNCGEQLAWLTWIYPVRPLKEEFERVLKCGYLKGADLWHIACALFLDPQINSLNFLTLDKRQQEVATLLGFPR